MFDVLLLPTVFLLIALPVVYLLRHRPEVTRAGNLAVGVVRAITENATGADTGSRCVTVDVESSVGTFAGRLTYCADNPVAAAALRPGMPVLVVFDPAAREELSWPDQTSVWALTSPRPR